MADNDKTASTQTLPLSELQSSAQDFGDKLVTFGNAYEYLQTNNKQLQQEKDVLKAELATKDTEIAQLKEDVRYRSEIANKVGRELEDLKLAQQPRTGPASPFWPPKSTAVLFPRGYDGRN